MGADVWISWFIYHCEPSLGRHSPIVSFTEAQLNLGDGLLSKPQALKRALVIYHFFEKDQSYIDNFCHFLRFTYEPHQDFLIIVAGTHSMDMPHAPNIQYFHVANQNFDYGGYAKAIKALAFEKFYDYFVFVNASVRGPFIPPYAKVSWLEALLALLTPQVGIAGTAISLTPKEHAIAKLYHAKFGKSNFNHEILAHVQTTCYALPQSSLQYLIDQGFYEALEPLSKDETVRDYEIHLSQQLLANQLNHKCILPEYNQFDYPTLDHEINPTSREGDSGFVNSYFGRTAHPYESMFIKTSRNTFPDLYLKQLASAMSINMPCNPAIAQSKAIQEYELSCQRSIGFKNHEPVSQYLWQKLFNR